MTILYGDARFYNNIFVQKEIRQDLAAYAEAEGMGTMDKYQFICGTKPYDGYPTAETYFGRFNAETAVDHDNKDIYYDHLPIYTGGNVYFNGAKPCDAEENYKVDEEHKITLELKEEGGEYRLETNLYDYLPKFETPFVSTELLGEAFEPEQKFEAPDGAPIVFDRDYFGRKRDMMPLAGPFACGCEIEDVL